MRRPFPSSELQARSTDDTLLDLLNRQVAVDLGIIPSVMDLERPDGNIDLPHTPALTPTQADLIDAGLAAGKSEEDVAMDNINDGGDDNPAQFAT